MGVEEEEFGADVVTGEALAPGDPMAVWRNGNSRETASLLEIIQNLIERGTLREEGSAAA
jgi:hypothetical protein